MIKIIYLHLLAKLVPRDLLGFMFVYYSKKLNIPMRDAQKMTVIDFLEKVEG